MPFDLLIVDDSSTTRSIIRKILGMTGLEIGNIEEAADGSAGLSKLSGAHFDLVLADLNMPVMNGMDMISAMAADSALKQVPVVVVSSEGSQTVLDSLAEKGVRQVIRKPFEAVLLRRVIEQALQVKA
jgi:two-component system chemotaxis response regulator CheY